MLRQYIILPKVLKPNWGRGSNPMDILWLSGMVYLYIDIELLKTTLRNACIKVFFIIFLLPRYGRTFLFLYYRICSFIMVTTAPLGFSGFLLNKGSFIGIGIWIKSKCRILSAYTPLKQLLRKMHSEIVQSRYVLRKWLESSICF